jgi:hypothetical protein
MLRHEVGREVVVTVPLGDVRLDGLGGEVAHDRPEVLVVLAQLEHSAPLRAVVPAPGRGEQQVATFLTLTST